MKHLITFLLFAGLLACQTKNDSPTSEKGKIEIQWMDSIDGNFSFANQWSYLEGIYKNEFGQLSCDGLCPAEIDAFKDSTGRIYDDSLNSFYKIIDTTHQMHSIECEAWCYEWAGTDFMDAIQRTEDTLECNTLCNAATHCSLHFYLVENICNPSIELKSISSGGNVNYPCKGGYIKIDSGFWKKGIVKAEFSLTFEHKENPKQDMFWKGRIFSKIKPFSVNH